MFPAEAVVGLVIALQQWPDATIRCFFGIKKLLIRERWVGFSESLPVAHVVDVVEELVGFEPKASPFGCFGGAHVTVLRVFP